MRCVLALFPALVGSLSGPGAARLAPRRARLTARRAAAAFAASLPDLPVIWQPEIASPTRRTLRSRVTEFCVRGWIREQRARKRLDFASSDIASAAPAKCGFAGSSDDDEEGVGRACAEVIAWTGENMRWWGYERQDRPKLQLRRLDAELTNLHRRVLTRGRRGSVRATLALDGADVDGSVWIRGFLERIVARILREVDGYDDPSFDFRTSVARDDVTGAPRVRLDGATEDGVGFVASFLLAAEHGALVLRSPEVFLQNRPTFRLKKVGNVAVPAAVLEDLGRLYLSTVAVDASAKSGAAFAVVAVRLAADSGVEVEVVSSAASRAAMRRLARKHQTVPDPGPGPKKPEWRLHLNSVFKGRAHPVRHTFVVGERLPWILNPRSAAPVAVIWVFRTLGLAFSIAAVPDRVYRGVVGAWKRFRLPRRRRGTARGDGLPVVRGFRA